jgi:outer membrane lipoprotein
MQAYLRPPGKLEKYLAAPETLLSSAVETSPLRALIICLSLMLYLWGCVPISPALVQQSEPSLSFAALKADPEAYRGRRLILGGEVMTVSLLEGDSLLLVHQKELDPQLRPVDPPSYGGEFQVLSRRWLAPDAYFPPRKVTVAGEVLGQRAGVPFLRATEIYLWEDPRKLDDLLKEWFDPALHYWYTPPYFDPWRPGGGRR